MLNVHDLYEALVTSFDGAIVTKDVEGVVMSWNPGAELLFGYTAEEMIGQSIRKIIPPDRQQEEDLVLQRIRAGERIGQLITRRLHKEGHLIDVAATISPVRDKSGVIVGASKVARNIGYLVENQRRLRESEERFRMLADNISQFAWIANAEGHLFWYNQRWYDFSGTNLEEMEGWGWKRIHHPDHVERVEEVWRKALKRGTEWEDTFPLRGANGEYRWFLSRAKPIRDDAGQIVFWFGTNTDITEQREQAEQIRLLLMEVNHRAKNMLATVQALARQTAHSDREFIKRFEQRIHSLAINQDILVQREWREVPMAELVQGQLSFVDSKPGQLQVGGPDAHLNPRAAEIIGMALHELATNSLKYGALSSSAGHAAIGWSVEQDPAVFKIWWRESGGPPVVAPRRQGFGTTLIRDVPRRALDAEVLLDYPSCGLQWEVTAPAKMVT